MNFYPDHLYVNFDGSNSSAPSNVTTPHGTLTRNHVNNVKMAPRDHPNGIANTPRSTLRSHSQHSMPNGRTNSVVGLSERSVTGASVKSFSSVQHPSERVGLLSQTSQT